MSPTLSPPTSLLLLSIPISPSSSSPNYYSSSCSSFRFLHFPLSPPLAPQLLTGPLQLIVPWTPRYLLRPTIIFHPPIPPQLFLILLPFLRTALSHYLFTPTALCHTSLLPTFLSHPPLSPTALFSLLVLLFSIRRSPAAPSFCPFPLLYSSKSWPSERISGYANVIQMRFPLRGQTPHEKKMEGRQVWTADGSTSLSLRPKPDRN